MKIFCKIDVGFPKILNRLFGHRALWWIESSLDWNSFLRKMHILHFFYGASLEWCLEDMDRKIQLGGERSCLLLLIVLKSEKTSFPPSAQTIHLREFGLPHVSPLSLFASLVSRASCWEGKKRERRKLALGFFTLSVSPYFKRPHPFCVTSLFF